MGRSLDSVDPDADFVAMEVGASSGSTRAALVRLFAYVSAARLSHSPQRRWEAIHAVVHMLWDESGLSRSVTGAQLDQLFGIDPGLLQSVLPQLIYYVLTHSGPVCTEVKAFLLRTCAASSIFGYEVYWLLLAQPCRIDTREVESIYRVCLEQMKHSVSRVLEFCVAPMPRIACDGNATDGGSEAVISQFRRELHLVHTLTSISDQLRTVEPSHRLERLRAALVAVNRLLPRFRGPTAPTWRAFVPLSERGDRHAIVRFFENESFVLSTKERVPYLVFVEVVDADPSLLEHSQVESSVAGAMATIGKLSRVVASRAANFARRQNLSFERMPASSRRSRAESCAVHVASDGSRTESLGTGDRGLHAASIIGLPSPSRPRSNSNPEVTSKAASLRLSDGRVFEVSARLLRAADAEEEALVIEGDPATLMPTPLPVPSTEQNAPLADEPEPEAAATSSRLHAVAMADSNGGTLLPLRPDESGMHVACPAEDEEEFDYTVNEGFGELWQERADRLRASSSYASMPGWAVHAFIVKSNDELLQEQFAVSMIHEFDRIFRHCRLPLRLRPYRILATSPTAGLIEVVPNAKSLDSVKKSTPSYFSLADFFRRRYGGAGSVSFHRARRNFVQSVAAYSIISYLLQLKDRHNGNILLHANGSVIHIDFGFLLSNSPGKNMGFEAAPFKLTGEWVELMGGIGSPWFRYYRTLVVRGFQEARRHREKVLLLVQATFRGVGGSFPCFRAGENTIDSMRQRFQPEMTQQQYARYAASLIDNSLDNWTTGAYDCYQRCCLGIL